MVADKLHEKTAECEGHVDDQPILVAAEIEDHPIVAHEIDGGPELALYLGWVRPVRRGRNGQPRAIGRPTLINETGELLPSPS
jgi:hypothetical protein